MPAVEQRHVYVIGAGLSAGIRFPTITQLLPQIWGRLAGSELANDLSRVIRFHHPDFNPARPETFPNVEELLSEMQANSQLFDSSRPATGGFNSDELDDIRERFLLEIAAWFHELQHDALDTCPEWLRSLVAVMQNQNAKIVSFNWDLVLDQLLFGDELSSRSYGLQKSRSGAVLLKPHGSLNWFEKSSGQHLQSSKTFPLGGRGPKAVLAFKPYRAPKSAKRIYMPLIVPPVFAKSFHGPLFQRLWRETVSALSTASHVTFLGYSLPQADFHARFIFRCGFHNQEFGELMKDGKRSQPTGRAAITVVDPIEDGPKRIRHAVGWECDWKSSTIESWMPA